jgi:hypothetical protein
MGVEHHPHLDPPPAGLQERFQNGGTLQLELLEQQFPPCGCDQVHNRLTTVIRHHQQALVRVAHVVSAVRAARYRSFELPFGFNLLPPQAKP